MRALLIDPIEQKVSEFDYDGDSSKIYEMLETEGHRPRFFDVVSIPWGMDGIYIDDEGLYAPIQYRWSFHAKTHYSEPLRLVNRALVIGCDDNGESDDCTSGVELGENNITWGWDI